MFYFRELIYTAALYTYYKVMNKSVVPIAVKRKWYRHIEWIWCYYDDDKITTAFEILKINEKLRRELSLRRLVSSTYSSTILYFNYYPIKNSKMRAIQFFDYCHISNIFFDIERKSKKIQLDEIRVPFYGSDRPGIICRMGMK